VATHSRTKCSSLKSERLENTVAGYLPKGSYTENVSVLEHASIREGGQGVIFLHLIQQKI
jgi:hypothetical protein